PGGRRLSTDPNRQRPRSSKKRRAVQTGAGPRPGAGAGGRGAGGRVHGGRGSKPAGSSSADAYGGPSSAVTGSISVVEPSGAGGSPVAGASGAGIPAGCPKSQPPAAAAGST